MASSVVLRDAPPPSPSDYFLQVRTLGGVTLPNGGPPERPDSDMPEALRYPLGAVMASASVGFLVGGIKLTDATLDLFQSDAPLGGAFGIYTGMGAVGVFGLSVVTGIWAVRLFRGKVVLLP